MRSHKMGEGWAEQGAHVHPRDRSARGSSPVLPRDYRPELLPLDVLLVPRVSLVSATCRSPLLSPSSQAWAVCVSSIECEAPCSSPVSSGV